MKKIIPILYLFILHGSILFAQNRGPEINPDSIQPSGDYENVTNQLLYSDSSVTTFLIWVKHSVPMHKHAWHTEQVTVLEGSAEMTVGDKLISIQKGDMIFIPENTYHSVQVTSAAPLKVLSIQAPEFKGDDRIFPEK